MLATGHVHPEEIIAVVKRGKELGVKNMLINHALTNVPGMTMAQAKQVTDMGAVIEICFLQFLAGPNAPLPFLTHWTQVNAKNVAQAVKELGANSVLISSDLGQSGNMVHPDGLEAAIAAMKKEGVSDGDIDTMMRTATPALPWFDKLTTRVETPLGWRQAHLCRFTARGCGVAARPLGLPTMVTISSWPSNRRLAARLTSASVTASISALRRST